MVKDFGDTEKEGYKGEGRVDGILVVRNKEWRDK